jgi:PAS domain-containing protein
MFFVGRDAPGLAFVNEGLLRFTGRSADFFLDCDSALPAEQQSLRSLVHPADLGRIAAVYRAYRETASTGVTDSSILPSEEECRILAANGTYRWCRTYIARVGCTEPRPGHVELLFYAVDIQELKDLQAKVEDERALLTAAINQLPVGCAVVKPTGAISLFNQELRRMFAGAPVGTTNSVEQYGEWVGYHPDGRRYEAMDWPLARSLVKGEVIAGEDHIVGLSDGSRGIARVNTAPVYSSSGTLIAGVMVIEDVTQEKQRAEDRTRFEAVQRAADAMRSLMVSGRNGEWGGQPRLRAETR